MFPQTYFLFHPFFWQSFFYTNFSATTFSHVYFFQPIFRFSIFPKIFELQFWHRCIIFSPLIFSPQFFSIIFFIYVFFSTVFLTKSFAAPFCSDNFYTGVLSFSSIFLIKHFYSIFPGTIFSSWSFSIPFSDLPIFIPIFRPQLLYTYNFLAVSQLLPSLKINIVEVARVMLIETIRAAIDACLTRLRQGIHLWNILHERCFINILRATYLQLSAH